MIEILAKIKSVLGVLGAGIVSIDGVRFSQAMPDIITSEQVISASRMIQQARMGIEYTGSMLKRIIFFYYEYILVAQIMRQANLLILCEPSVNLSLLTLTINSLIRPIEEKSELGEF